MAHISSAKLEGKRHDAKKLEQERLQGFIQEMLREEENKYCADCEAKQPRWASWNLGLFLCIRCAGLHRNLGVHVSKVKSITLDTWTEEQIQSMRVMGNAKAKVVYECELPPMFRRPQNDQGLEQFIRAKYEHKRYIMKDWVAPSVNIADLPPQVTSGTANHESGSQKTSLRPLADEKNGNAMNKVLAESTPPSLIDFSSSPPVQASAISKDSGNVPNLVEGGFDLFGPIVSAPASNDQASPNPFPPKTSSLQQHTNPPLNAFSDDLLDLDLGTPSSLVPNTISCGGNFNVGGPQKQQNLSTTPDLLNDWPSTNTSTFPTSNNSSMSMWPKTQSSHMPNQIPHSQSAYSFLQHLNGGEVTNGGKQQTGSSGLGFLGDLSQLASQLHLDSGSKPKETNKSSNVLTADDLDFFK